MDEAVREAIEMWAQELFELEVGDTVNVVTASLFKSDVNILVGTAFTSLVDDLNEQVEEVVACMHVEMDILNENGTLGDIEAFNLFEFFLESTKDGFKLGCLVHFDSHLIDGTSIEIALHKVAATLSEAVAQFFQYIRKEVDAEYTDYLYEGHSTNANELNDFEVSYWMNLISDMDDNEEMEILNVSLVDGAISVKVGRVFTQAVPDLVDLIELAAAEIHDIHNLETMSQMREGETIELIVGQLLREGTMLAARINIASFGTEIEGSKLEKIGHALSNAITHAVNKLTEYNKQNKTSVLLN